MGKQGRSLARSFEWAVYSRLSGLSLSPDGRRLVVAVATPDRENTRYRTALWEVDPAGTRPARRLTRSGKTVRNHVVSGAH